MTRLDNSITALEEAYAARDAAEARAIAEVHRQFATLINRRQLEYSSAAEAHFGPNECMGN